MVTSLLGSSTSHCEAEHPTEAPDVVTGVGGGGGGTGGPPGVALALNPGVERLSGVRGGKGGGGGTGCPGPTGGIAAEPLKEQKQPKPDCSAQFDTLTLRSLRSMQRKGVTSSSRKP